MTTKQANLFPVFISVILLTLVMGGRTSLFVSQFDQIGKITIAGADLTVLSIVLAIALMFAVVVASWWRSHFGEGHRGYRAATWAMYGGAALDGMFNTSEAILLAQESGRLANQSQPIVIGWLWVSVIMIGAGPTVLTVLLASLAGTIDAVEQGPRLYHGTCQVCGAEFVKESPDKLRDALNGHSQVHRGKGKS